MSRADLEEYWRGRNMLVGRGKELGPIRLIEEKIALETALAGIDPVALRCIKSASSVILIEVAHRNIDSVKAWITGGSDPAETISLFLYDLFAQMDGLKEEHEPNTDRTGN